MVYSKNQTKISFYGEFNENKLNYICDVDTSMPKRAANTTKGQGNRSPISIGSKKRKNYVRAKKNKQQHERQT